MTSVLGDHWGPQEQVRGREKREGKGGTEHRLGGTPSPDPVWLPPLGYGNVTFTMGLHGPPGATAACWLLLSLLGYTVSHINRT